MEKKRRMSREALSEPGSPALGHGGLFPRLPRSLQSACVAFLSCDDVAEIDLVSKAGRELCRVYFERIERCVASGRAAQTLALRFACRLRELHNADFGLQSLNDQRKQRLRSVLGLSKGASIVEHIIHRNQGTLGLIDRDDLSSVTVILGCERLHTIDLVRATCRRSDVTSLLSELASALRHCRQITCLMLGVQEYPLKLYEAVLAAAPPLQSLQLTASEEVLGSLAEALCRGKHALSSLNVVVVDYGWSTEGLLKLLSSVRSTLTRLDIDANGVFHGAAWPKWELPALRHLGSCVPMRLRAPKLETVSLDRAGWEFLLGAVEQESQSVGFPKLVSYREATDAVPLHHLVRLRALTAVDIRVADATANACFRYLVLQLPCLVKLCLLSSDPPEADDAAADVEQARLLKPFESKRVASESLRELRASCVDDFKDCCLPALQSASATFERMSTGDSLQALFVAAPALEALRVRVADSAIEPDRVQAVLRLMIKAANEGSSGGGARLRALTVSLSIKARRDADEARVAKQLLELQLFQRLRGLRTVKVTHSLGLVSREFAFDRESGLVVASRSARN